MNSTLQQGEAAPGVEAHLAAFNAIERDLARPARPGLQRLRRSAIANFGELGFPGPRHEDWKFTNLAPFTRTTFLSPPQDSEMTAAKHAQNLLHGVEPGVTLATINHNRPFLLAGSQPLPAGVLVTSLSEALQSHPELVERHLGQHADFKSHPFVALNTAFWRDGVFVYVPANTVVEGPVQLPALVAAYNDNGPYLWYRRILIVLERGSQATVVESYSGPGWQYATNAVTEVVLGENANLDHYKLQEESPLAFHFGCTQITQARSSRFSTHYVGFGGGLVRNEVRVLLDAEGCEATVNGLYQAGGTQHTDNHTVIDHAKPHCASHELYKGILDGKARGVFNGKIFVRQDAQKTDAKQTNQTLLLSDDATINTKPQLEIFADDVKCTHGATVGQLDAEQLFYLRARGIGSAEARALLTFAFANDIISRIRVERLRQRLEQTLLVSRHLPSPELLSEES